MSSDERGKVPPRPQPIPNPNQRIKKQSIEMIVKHEGKWVFRKQNVQYSYDMVLRKWLRDSTKSSVEFIPIAERGVLKKQTLKLLVVREGLDPATVRRHVFYGVIELTAKVPQAPEYQDIFLTVFKAEKHGRRRVAGHFIINDLAENTFGTQKLDFTHIWVSRSKTEKRVTPKQAQKLFDSGEVADIVSEDPDGNFSPRKIVFKKRI